MEREVERLLQGIEGRRDARRRLAFWDREIAGILARHPDLEVINDTVVILSEDAGNPDVVADELARMGVGNADRTI